MGQLVPTNVVCHTKKQKRSFWGATCKVASQQTVLSHTLSPCNASPDNSGVRQAMPLERDVRHRLVGLGPGYERSF